MAEVDSEAVDAEGGHFLMKYRGQCYPSFGKSAAGSVRK